MGQKQSRVEKDAAAQRARAQKAAAMGPGRTSPEDVLSDVVATMDLDVRRLKLKAEEGEPLTVGESQSLGNYGRVLQQWVSAKLVAKEKGAEGDMTDEQLEEEAQRIAKQVAHAKKQARS